MPHLPSSSVLSRPRAIGAVTVGADASQRPLLLPGDVVVFLFGVLCWVQIHFIGTLYLGELIFVGYALRLPRLYSKTLTRSERSRVRWFLALALMYMGGLIFSDLYRGAQFEDLARGWSRAGFFLTDAAGILVLAITHRRRVFWWLAGMLLSLGGAVLIGSYTTGAPVPWKLGLGEPVTLLAVLLANRVRGIWTYALLALAACCNLFLDYRSMAAFAAITFLLVYIKSRRTGSKKGLWMRPAVLGLVIVVLFTVGYLANFSVQLRGSDLVDRRSASNVGRAAALIVVFQAVRRSPVIGHGSWARSADLYSEWAYLQAEMGGTMSPEAVLDYYGEEQGYQVPVHSEILQAWFEAGLPGLAFFLYLLVATSTGLWRLISNRTVVEGFVLVTFWSISNMWALLLSPFAGVHRIFIAVGLAMLLVFSRRDQSIPLQ
jgi:O-antigen ligase